MNSTIKIRIGASLDRSAVDGAFGALEARARKAGMVVQRELNRGMTAGSGRGGPYRAAAREAEQSYDQQTRAARRSYSAQEQAAREASKVAQRELDNQTKASQRAGRERERELDRFARRTSYRATRFLFPPPSGLLGSARRMGTDLLRGAGIDFSFGNAVGRNVDLQKSAVALSNQGYQAGATGAAGQRVSASTLMSESRGVGSEFGIDPAKIMAAHEAFVSITGDLATSRASMRDMAQLSSATGTDIVDMANAQANVAMQLGNTDNKAAKVAAIMRMIAGQGKIGAVEVKDLARGMAGLAAQAPAFAGNVSENIEKMGALAQIARAYGGAKTSAQAVTSVERFVTTLQTPARLKAFKKAGVSVYDKGGKIRDPLELIKESLVSTGGDQVKMAGLFSSVMGARGVRGFTNAFNTAGGGQAGMAAVNELFGRFMKGAALSPEDIQKNASLAANSDAAKAQRFQIEIDKIAQKLQAQLLPALEKLAPVALNLADKFASLVKWTAENPGKAITAAIVASIARAGLESAARGALERLIKGLAHRAGFGAAVPGETPAGATPVAGGARPGAGPGLAIATTAAVAGVALAADQASKLRNETGGTHSLLDIIPGFKNGSFSTDELLHGWSTGGISNYTKAWKAGKGAVSDIFNYDENLNKKARADAQARAAADAKDKAATAADIGRSVADGMAGRTLNVRLMNPEDIKPGDAAPKVDPNGRQPPPGKR